MIRKLSSIYEWKRLLYWNEKVEIVMIDINKKDIQNLVDKDLRDYNGYPISYPTHWLNLKRKETHVWYKMCPTNGVHLNDNALKMNKFQTNVIKLNINVAF